MAQFFFLHRVGYPSYIQAKQKGLQRHIPCKKDHYIDEWIIIQPQKWGPPPPPRICAHEQKHNLELRGAHSDLILRHVLLFLPFRNSCMYQWPLSEWSNLFWSQWWWLCLSLSCWLWGNKLWKWYIHFFSLIHSVFIHICLFAEKKWKHFSAI